MADSDRIEKQITLRAPRARVWRALTSSREFGEWFRCKFDDEFAVGKVMRLTLSCDHRIVDGATAARFLKDLKAQLEAPDALLG